MIGIIQCKNYNKVLNDFVFGVIVIGKDEIIPYHSKENQKLKKMRPNKNIQTSATGYLTTWGAPS